MRTVAGVTILEGAQLLGRHGGVVEVRILKTARGTVSGYFDNLEALVKAVQPWDGKASIYITANPVRPELLGRATNRLREYARETTADREILRRAWFLTDFDAERPAGISATDAELALAVARRNDAVAFLLELGFPAPVLAMSGNGAHALFPVNLPNDEASTRLLEQALKALAARFTAGRVTCDETVSNAARIWKLYGTVAVKGDPLPDRPHRRAYLEHVPADLVETDRQTLEVLAAMAPIARTTYSAPAAGGHHGGLSPLDLLATLRDRGLYRGPLERGRHALTCPWKDAHSTESGLSETCVFEPHGPGEPWGFDCRHSHCAHRTIRDLLAWLWPGGRNGDAGHSPDELRCEVAEAPPWNPGATINPKAGQATRWDAAVSAPAFLSAEEPDADFLEDRLLARGSLTMWFSPRGLGKTLAGHAYGVKHAKLGRRVLLIDRDNSRREVKRRLRAWGAEEAPTFKILTRDTAPALTDRAAWAAFPFAKYDLVLIDSIDASTEGVGENDSAKPAAALAPILDIAHREAGPAILLLGNVIKSGSHGRGSGVVEDRADIVYEVRDATNLQPTGSKPWWLELPAAGREAWGERAARRKKRESFRLAFVPSKFRIGEEPDPFILEVDLATEPWVLRDVTSEVDAAGQAALEAAQADRRQRLEVAAQALAAKVEAAVAAGDPWDKTKAEAFLRGEHKLKRDVARGLITDRTGTLWRAVTDKTRPGNPSLLLPAVEVEGGQEVPTAAERIGENTPPTEGYISAVRSSSGRRKSPIKIAAPVAGMEEGADFRRPENTSSDDGDGKNATTVATDRPDPWEEV
jgi:hypothetical protein